jgi:hypothetical protein
MSGMPRVELLEDFDGGRSAMTLDRERLTRALRLDEEALMLIEIGCLNDAENCCRRRWRFSGNWTGLRIRMLRTRCSGFR